MFMRGIGHDGTYAPVTEGFAKDCAIYRACSVCMEAEHESILLTSSVCVSGPSSSEVTPLSE